MQNELAGQDDFISLKDIVKIIIKRKKTLLWTTVVLFLLSAAVIFVTYKHKVTYQQTISLPYTYSGASQAPVLDITQTVAYINSQILPAWLEHYREAQLAAGKPIFVNSLNYKVSSFIVNDDVKAPILSPLIISFSYQTTREEKLASQNFKTVNAVIQSAIQDYMQPRLTSYITDVKNHISQLEYQIPILENDKEIEQGAKQHNAQTSDVNIQTMRDLYLASISDKDQYNMLFKAQTDLVTAKKNLQSLTKTLTVGNVVVFPDLKQQGRRVLLIFSLLISLLIGFIAVFIAEFTANLKK